MPNWLDEENKRIEESVARRLKDADIRPIVKIEEGVTPVSVDLKEVPRVAKTKYGDRHVINAVEPAGKCIMMSEMLYESFVKAMVGKSGIVKMNIIRVGKNREDTKYKIQVVP